MYSRKRKSKKPKYELIKPKQEVKAERTGLFSGSKKNLFNMENKNFVIKSIKSAATLKKFQLNMKAFSFNVNNKRKLLVLKHSKTQKKPFFKLTVKSEANKRTQNGFLFGRMGKSKDKLERIKQLGKIMHVCKSMPSPKFITTEYY